MATTQPNEKLAQLMWDANLSNKALARAVREIAAGCQPVSCDHTSVSRWLAGMQPRGRKPQFIAEVLSARLGRRITLADIGMSRAEEVPPDLGLTYADGVDQAAKTAVRLWQADLDEVPAVRAAPPHGDAWAEASLSWLVASEGDSLPVRSSMIRVGSADIEAVRATVDMFSQLDNKFGGGHARRALVQYLYSDLARLLSGRFSDAVGRKLFSVAAEATLLVGWMSYDAGLHGLAQRYFIQALRLAQAGNDVLLGGTILDAMSHQANFLGRHRQAVNLARAARMGTERRTTATLMAHFHAMEARALAAGGDVVGCQRVLSEAVRVFERRQPGDDPEWISYFDDAELSAEFSHCFRDIGRAADAITYAGRSLAVAGVSARSDFFVTMVLADGHLQNGDVEQACEVARRALDLGDQLRSARCVEYVRRFRSRLSGASAVAAQELADYGLQHPVWVAAGSHS